MDMTERANDLIFICERMIEILSKENEECDWNWDWKKSRRSKEGMDKSPTLMKASNNILNISNSRNNLDVSHSYSKLRSASNKCSLMINDRSFGLKSQLSSIAYGLGPQMNPSNVDNLMYNLNHTSLRP